MYGIPSHWVTSVVESLVLVVVVNVDTRIGVEMTEVIRAPVLISVLAVITYDAFILVVPVSLKPPAPPWRGLEKGVVIANVQFSTLANRVVVWADVGVYVV